MSFETFKINTYSNFSYHEIINILSQRGRSAKGSFRSSVFGKVLQIFSRKSSNYFHLFSGMIVLKCSYNSFLIIIKNNSIIAFQLATATSNLK